MMIFLKREFRESNLVSEKIDPLKGLLFSFLSLSVPQLGWRIFFTSFGQERNEFAFFSQKIVRRKTRKRREKSRRETFDEKRENGRREEERVR
jgi:hypothetical protein